MNTGEKLHKDNDIYNFTSSGFRQPKTPRSKDLERTSVPKYDPDQLNKVKIQQNNEKISKAIASQVTIQLIKNFSSPSLSNSVGNFLNLSLSKDTQNSMQMTPKQGSLTSRAKTIKKSDFRPQTNTRPPTPQSDKDEQQSIRKQIKELYQAQSQTNSKMASPTSTPDSIKYRVPKVTQNIALLESQLQAKATMHKEKVRTLSRALKRDTSYIVDALGSNPNSPGRTQGENYRDSPPLSTREAILSQTPTGPRNTVDMPRLKLVRQKSLFNAGQMQQTSGFSSARREHGEMELSSHEPLSILIRGDEKRTLEQWKYEADTAVSSLSGGLTARFSEHLSKNFNTDTLDRVSSSSYVAKRSFKLKGAMNINNLENLPIPKLGGITPFKTPRKKTEDDPMRESELVMSLKKECPCIFSSLPAGRQDVMMLSSWVQGKINEVISSSELDEAEKCMKCDEIYNLCLNELLRQVSLECVERGELLYKVWTSYYQVILQYRSNIDADNHKEKATYSRDLKEQSELFQSMYVQKCKEAETLKQEFEKSEKEKIELKQKYEEIAQKEAKYKNKIEHLKNSLSQLKNYIHDLKDENQALSKRQIKQTEKPEKSEKSEKRLEYKENKPGGVQLFVQPPVEEVNAPKNIFVLERGDSLHKTPTLFVPVPDASQHSNEHHSELNGTMSSKFKNSSSGRRNSINSDTDSDSEKDLEFLDIETNMKRKFTFDQLNANLLAHRAGGSETPMSSRFVDPDTDEQGTQTFITLIPQKYNDIFENQALLDELLVERTLKKDIDIFADATEKLLMELDPHQKILQEKMLEKWTPTEIKEKLGSFSIPEPILESILNLTGQVRAVQKRMSTEILNNGSISSNDKNMTNQSAEFKVIIGDPILVEHEFKKSEPQQDPIFIQDDYGQENEEAGTTDEKSVVGNIVIKLGSIGSVEDKISPVSRVSSQKEVKSEKNLSPIVIRIGTIQENEARQEGEYQLNDTAELQMTMTEENNTTETELTQEVVRGETRKDTLQIGGRPRVIRRSVTIGKIEIENNDYEGDAFAAQQLLADMLANKRSVGSQEYTKTPNDSGGEEEERPRMILKKSSIKLVEDEQIKEDLDNSIEKMKNNFAAHRLGPMEEVSFKRDSLKRESMKMRDYMKDKTRLILLTRMYRIEKEKVKGLQTDVENLQNEVIAGKENIEDYQKKMEELNEKIKEVEKKRRKCIHKVCPICGDQANREEEEEEEPEGESANQGSLNKSDLLSGEDAPLEGDGEEDDGDPATRSKRSLRKKTRQPTVGTLPEFNKKKPKKDPKVNPATAIIASIKETGMRKFKNFMAIKGVLKHIFTLYSDRSRDNMIDKDEEFPSFVYNWFLNNFGFKKLAEQKFIVFLLSVKKYLYVVRINLFARFMGLLDGSSNYNLEELNKYLEAIEYTSKLNLGSPIQNNETDTKHYIAFLKAADYVKYFSETKMPLEEYMEFRRSIEIIKETDPKGINRNGILDFDLLMTKVLAKYRILCNRTKQNVVTAFKAADLDGNKNCSLKEFITLYRNIEQDKYDAWFAETVFNEHADVKVEGQMHLSFDKFTVVCVEYGLFSDAQQDQFLEVQSEEEILTKLHDMKEEWERRKLSMMETLDIMTKIPKEEVSYWKDILEALGDRVTSCEDTDTQEIKPLVIAYKILKQEIEKLREEDMEVDLYGVKRMKTLERSESQAISPLRTEADKKKFFRGMTTVVKSNEAAPKLNKSDTAT